MCISGIDHTSNGYYSALISTRTVFCLLWKGQYEPTEAYYRRCEASIYTAELETCTVTTYTELRWTYTRGNYDDVTRRFQEMCLLMFVECECFSDLQNNLKNNTLIGTYNYLDIPTAASVILCRYNNITPPQPQSLPSALTFLQINDPNRTAFPGSH